VLIWVLASRLQKQFSYHYKLIKLGMTFIRWVRWWPILSNGLGNDKSNSYPAFNFSMYVFYC